MYLRDMLDTLVDVDNEDLEEFIMYHLNFFQGHVIRQFRIVFESKSITNSFRYLRDMLVTIVDVDNEDLEEFIMYH